MSAELPPERFEVHALNLTEVRPLTPDGVAARCGAAADGPLVIAGYSMGARLALHAALAMPRRVQRLVLISGSAGIEDAAGRAARASADEELALALEHGGLTELEARWSSLPLFAEDPAWVREEVAREQSEGDAAALAACLRGFGAGAMAPMWERLGELSMEVSALAGERDRRYVELGRRLSAGLPRGELTVVPGARHRLALEAPGAVAAAIAG